MLRSYFGIIKCVGDGLPSLNCSLHDFQLFFLLIVSSQAKARPKWSEEKLFTNKRETKAHTRAINYIPVMNLFN